MKPEQHDRLVPGQQSRSQGWRLFLRTVLVSFLIFSLGQDTSSFGQQTTTTQQTDKTDTPPPEEKPKKQKTETRSTAMAANGDSAAGSIGGIKTPESVKVSSGGAATLSIPMIVPPGTAGVQPNLSFNYNSQGENSLLGLGWSVGGLPIIHRCPRTVAQDGFRGAINYDTNDRFCLDGQRLMKISSTGNYGDAGVEYRTEVDSFLKITSYGNAGGGPAYFTVKTKGGETMEFGGNATSDQGRIEAQGKSAVRVWALSKMSDIKGNYLLVTYHEDSANGEYRPKDITYTYNDTANLPVTRKVAFAYDENGVNRADKIPQWVGGSKILTTKLLTSIKTYAPAPGTTSPLLLVRDYRLEYETGSATLRTRLKLIKECDAVGNCLPLNTPSSQPAWQFTWQEGGDGTFQYVAGESYDTGNLGAPHVITADVNGDGKMDFVTTASNKLWTWLSNGDGTFQKFSLTYNNSQMNNDMLWRADINGDGNDDFITHKNGVLYTYISLGNGQYQTPIPSQSVSGPQFNPLKVWIGDFNGDGRTDLITFENAKFHTYFSNGNGTYQVVSSGTFQSNEIAASYIFSGDFNGDGKMDMASIFSGKIWTYFSNGDGTFLKVMFDRNGNPLNPGYVEILDLNGDGRSDIVSHVNPLWIYLSKSDGTYEFVEYIPPVDVWFIDDVPRFGDFNGDGKTDIVAYNICPDEQPACPVFLTTFFSKGDGTFNVVQQPAGSIPIYPIHTWVGDFDGDGKQELLSPGLQSKLYRHVQTGPYPDLLTNLTNPFGGQNAITYKPLSTGSPYYFKDTGSACPPGESPCYSTMHLQYPLYVVTDLVINDGQDPAWTDLNHTYAHQYTYGGARAHHLGRGSLGFHWMTEVDIGANLKTSTFYKQFFPHTGLPETVASDRYSDNAKFRGTIHEYFNENAYSTVAPTLSFVAPKQVDILEWDGSATQYRQIRREFLYDSAATGNLSSTFHRGDVNAGGDEREEVTLWIPVDANAWLHRAKTLQLKNGSGNVVREKFLYYDDQAHGILGSAGLVTKEEANAGGGIGQADNPVFLYTYDSATGVRTNVRDPRLCDTTTVYESTKTFPQSVAVCSNVSTLNFVTSYQYDPRHGVVQQMIEPYRAGDTPIPTTNYDYDGFGRQTKVINALDTASSYGTETKQYLDWGNPAAQRVVTLRTEEHSTGNVLWTEEYFDGLGRIDQVRREGPDTSTSGKTIVTDRLFDSRNLVTRQSAAYFINSQGAPLETPKYEVITYDPLDRAIQLTHADNTFATKLYERGVITLTDERGKITKKHFDGLEQLTKVQEYISSQPYDTTYERDAAGSLQTVTNTLGHKTRIDYDMLGRKRTMCDPNMGTISTIGSCPWSSPPTGAWVYTYNPAGDLLTQKDAKNQTLTFAYDELGRPLTKKQGSTTITSWTYDDATVMHSTGRVTQVVDLPSTQNTITKFAYDVLGQVTQSQRVLLGVTYTMTQTYDALGRIKTETFPAPDNETVSYNYNEAGWLKSVNNYINDIQYNARGQRKTVTYYNGLTSTFVYNDPVDRPSAPSDFRMFSRATSNNQQSLTYSYDPVGSILSITDGLFTGSRTFTYDDTNRLSTTSGTFGLNQSQQNCSYAYNAIGNFLDKCGATLSYGDAMHPSAVTNNSATGKNYTYDNNGNMTARGNQTLTWDIDNRVTSVSISGGGTTYMEYDYSGMRVKKNAPAGITLFPFKGVEIDPNGTLTKFIKIGNETFASKKTTSGGATTQYFYHNDHLGSVNVITDITGTRCQLNEYEPWGGVSRSDVSSPACDPTHRFTAQELDPETGFYYYGGRYFDQEIGSFVSPDPFVQAPDMPQNLNRYSYVLNNPVNYTDPNGHFFWAIIAAVAAIVEAVSVESITLAVLKTLAGKLIAISFATSLQQLPMKTINQAELHRARQQQQQDNLERTRPQILREDPLSLNRMNPGDDYPDEVPWWKQLCLAVCAAHAADEPDNLGRRSPIPNPRYGVIVRIPGKITGTLEKIWKDRRLFERWLRAEQSAKRIENPLTADEAKRVLENARNLKIPEREIDLNQTGLAGAEKTGKWAGIPHFKIGGTHIPVEPGVILQ